VVGGATLGAVVRELVCGSQHFNDLRRGVPRMSPTLLSKRLHQLTRAGIVERLADGRYVRTDAGQELRPVVEAVGTWGIRWMGELGDADLDPKLLLWDMSRSVDHAAVPPGRTVLRFEFPEQPGRTRRWWLVIDGGDADMCDADPGHPVAVTVRSSLRDLTRVWRGDVGWSAALRSGLVHTEGPSALCRAMPGWFTPSDFAAVPRPAAAPA
jgi:DNA-binding HxlR family transcriptional regulator